ncbi:MAG: hypothetical protein ACKVZ0_22750 [Gemmatimonadales bacterium]
MAFRRSTIVAVFAATALAAGSAQAQTDRLHLGPRISYQFDLEEIGIGLQLGVPIAKNLEFYPSFDYFLVDPGTFWNLNADLKYRLPDPSIRWLYLGGGLNIARASGGGSARTRAGVNLLAGVESLKGRVHPFGEFRFTANDGSTGQLAVGVNFTLSSH